jgi:hypothetical protein
MFCRWNGRGDPWLERSSWLDSSSSNSTRVSSTFLSDRRVRKLAEQPVCLSDLGHFGRRRKAFERRRENGVRFDGAARRLVELGECKRRAQTPATRALLSRDGDGALESFFGGGRTWRTTLEQELTTKKMGERQVTTIRDGRLLPGTPSGARLGRPLCPTIRSRDRRAQPG